MAKPYKMGEKKTLKLNLQVYTRKMDYGGLHQRSTCRQKEYAKKEITHNRVYNGVLKNINKALEGEEHTQAIEVC